MLSAAGTGGVTGKQKVTGGQDGPHLPKLDVPWQDSQARIVAQSFRTDFDSCMLATGWDRK